MRNGDPEPVLCDHQRCDRELTDRRIDKVAKSNEKRGRELHISDGGSLDRIEAALLESVSRPVLSVDIFLGFVDIKRLVSLDVFVVSVLECRVCDENESCVDAKLRSEEGCLVDSGDERRDRLKFSRDLGEANVEALEEVVSSAFGDALYE